MTMEASLESFEFIADNIFRKKAVVSYRLVSRSLGIHQTQAKKILYEFYQKNKDKLDASFVISGNDASGTLIKFSENEQALEYDIKLFDKVHTIQIYGTSLKEINVTIEILGQEESKIHIDHDKIDSYVKNGMIKGPELKVVNTQQPENTRPAASNVPAKQNALNIKTEDSKPAKSVGLSSGYVSRKQNTTTARSNTISGYVSRKSEPVTPAKRSMTDPKPKYEYKSRKHEKVQPKERVIISSFEPQDEPEEVQSKPQTTTKTTELENLFADEFSDDDTTAMEVDNDNEPIAVMVEENETKPSEDVEMKDVKEDYQKDVSPQDNMDITESEPEMAQQSDEEDDSKKVHTKESVTDGGKVTFTSYRKKTTPKPDVKRQAVRSSTTEKNPQIKKTDNKKNDGKKKQSSLMSFFQKN